MKYFRIKRDGNYSYFYNAIDGAYRFNILKEDDGFVLYEIVFCEPGSRYFSPVLDEGLWYPTLKEAKSYAYQVLESNEKRRKQK